MILLTGKYVDRSYGLDPAVSFYVWLTFQKSRKDEIGRLAVEASKDITFPRTAKRLYYFLHYYRHEPEKRELIKNAHYQWRRMRKAQRAA